MEVDADAALGSHLARTRRDARGAEVLERDDQPLFEQRERALDELALLERIADLHGRALVLVGLAELRARKHRRAADPVPTGRRAVEHDLVADPDRRAEHELVVLGKAERHRVDQAVLLVRPLEVDLAADRRNADRVPVVADAAHGAVEQVARALARRRLAEPQRVEHGHGPGAQREDVAQDPADAGRGALERLDGARVVVRLDLEGAGQPVPGVDDTGVLARPDEHVLPLGRQRPQELLRVLVGAVLAPQQREHRELDLVRDAAELVDDQRVLVAREAERHGLLDGRRRRRLRHVRPGR